MPILTGLRSGKKTGLEQILIRVEQLLYFKMNLHILKKGAAILKPNFSPSAIGADGEKERNRFARRGLHVFLQAHSSLHTWLYAGDEIPDLCPALDVITGPVLKSNFGGSYNE